MLLNNFSSHYTPNTSNNANTNNANINATSDNINSSNNSNGQFSSRSTSNGLSRLFR